MKRFVQEDPIGFAADENVYAYVRGHVLDARDPSGNDVCYLEHHVTYNEYGNSGVIQPGSVGGYDEVVCDPDEMGPDGMGPLSNKGDGGGSSSVGTGTSTNSNDPTSDTQNPKCPAGAVQVSFGISAEAGGPLGSLGSFFAGASLTINFNMTSGQLSITASLSHSEGMGVYGGAGFSGGASFTPDVDLTPWQFTPSTDQEAVFNFGLEPSGGVVLSSDPDGGYGASKDVGDFGYGVGLQAAEGGSDSRTFAFPAFWKPKACTSQQGSH